MSDKIAATLSLDSTEFRGYSFGAPVSAEGPIVFSSAMAGYPETLTDPAYAGQIVVLTYPLIGNYGVPPMERDAHGLLRFFESEHIHIAGLVVTDYSPQYSHWNAVRSLGEWLQEQGVPAICGVDTRQITRILRDKGTQQAKLVAGKQKTENRKQEAGINATYGDGALKITLVDCGCTNGIIRSLLERGATITRVAADDDFLAIDCQAIVVAGGGDPAQYGALVERIAGTDKPIFGIGTGNLLLAQAAGAKLVRLPFGHHGHNIPVQQAGSPKGLITAQAHMYAVDAATLPKGWTPYYTNLNDGSCEGIMHHSGSFGVQFQPTHTHFDNLIALCKR